MTTTQPSFDPRAVTTQYTLTVPQVNLILEGLGKLPFDRVETLYADLRAHAIQALRIAEAASRADETVVSTGSVPTDTELAQASGDQQVSSP